MTINKQYNFAGDSQDICVYTTTCRMCGVANDITLDFQSYMKHYTGEYLIQDIWPNLSADERELILTGIHPVCWEKMFS
jgi:hypothetical protein